MKTLTRREFLKASGMSVALLGTGGVSSFAAEAKRRVVVIGGGWGGATAAKYIRLGDSSIEVTLLEPNKEFISELRRSEKTRRKNPPRSRNRDRTGHEARQSRQRFPGV